MPLWGPNRFWPGSGLVLRCLGPGFTVLALGPGFMPIFIHSFIYIVHTVYLNRSGLVIRCLGPGFTVLALGPG